jgi:predicted nucleic acid-binding protein
MKYIDSNVLIYPVIAEEKQKERHFWLKKFS